MIPKIIHCCWLSDEPKNAQAEKCRASWRKFAPGWEIREWSLSSISSRKQLPSFFRDAVAAKKWAFASDWVRFVALNEFGGVYFDYDFELVKPIAELPGGEWVAGQWMPNGCVGMEPAAIALEKDSPIAQTMLEHYATIPFGTMMTVGEIMRDMGVGGIGNARLAIRILEPEVMSPIGIDGKLHRTEKTVGIHWYAMSWASPQRKMAKWLSWHGMRWVVEGLLRVKRMFAR